VSLDIPKIAMAIFLGIDAAVFLLGLYFGFSAVDKFEVSKASATIGATQPIFIFFISWIFFGRQAMEYSDFAAFLLLFLGSVLISFERKPELTAKFLKLTVFSALMYSFDYVLIKYIFAELGFASGFVWRAILISLFALTLLLVKKNRKEIFKQKERSTQKLKKTFLATQVCGGLANILQSYAVFLAPVVLLPVANSMRGLQYVFLLCLTYFTSKFFPKILKEKISKKIILQKISAIALIIAGLIVLVI
jgi:drug/metabolite transporter (DMT)-like permease